MVSMLVPLLLASAGTGLTATQGVAPYQGVEVWLDTRAAYERGETARVHARAGDDGFLLVLHTDAAGRVRVLFPIDPYVDDFVRGGETLEIRGRSDRDAFLVDERSGAGLVLAAWSPDPFRFDEFVFGDHWDYHAMSPLRGVDAEADMLDLAQRMAGGPFDYDVAEYVVGNTTPYRRSPVHITTTSYDPWCAGCVRWGSAARSGFYLSVGLGTYGTHAALGYGPLYTSRPIWYRPISYRPVYHVPHYARAYRVKYHPVWGYYHPGRGPRWRHHYYRPYYYDYRPYYYDRSGFGIHVQYAGSSFGADLFYRSDDYDDYARRRHHYYARPRTRILTGMFDRPFDASGRRVQVRKAVPRNNGARHAGVRRATARYGIVRPADASMRTPLRATRVRIAQERDASERIATTRRASNGGNARAARPRLIREEPSSARIRASRPQQASARARSETRTRARARAWSASARTVQPRSAATRASTPSQVQRSARPAPSARSRPAAVRRAAPSRARPSARSSASRRSRPSIRSTRSASRPAAASRSSRPRTRAAQSSRRGGSAKARSSRSGGRRGGGKKR